MTKSLIKHGILKSGTLLLLVAGMLFSHVSLSQDVNKRILAEIDNEKLTVEEFLQIYRKNNIQVEELDPKLLEEYLELYINFRLKVIEAKELGLHNEQSFKDELKGYRAQLAKPYLVDEEATNQLVKEGWERMQEDLRVSHLLIRVERHATPEDTLAAFNKITELRKRIVNGESFASVAHEFSEDHSARDREAGGRIVRGNRGDLGYFTAFDMVYPFETAAYALKKGELSIPVRTNFGYHLIYLTDRKPAMGRVLAAHILLLFPPNPTQNDSIALEEKARMIYDKLQAGESFEDLANLHSDDRNTAATGGMLQWFGSNRMIPEFIYKISLLNEPGEYTKPFQSHFGWHIIKLHDQQKPGTFETMQAELKERVQKNERSVVIEHSLINRIKQEYGFKESQKALEPFYTAVTDSIFNATWTIPPKMRLRSELFSIGKQTYTQKNFADYLFESQHRRNPEPIRFYVDQAYQEFVGKKLLEYEDSQLEAKYPEFRALVREYSDGILLFELTDQKIWSMAVKDTAGLVAFHREHAHNYMWGERADASVFTFTGADQKLVDKAISLAANGIHDNEIVETINKEGEVVRVTRKLYSKGDSDVVDASDWTYGPKTPVEKDGKTMFVVIHNTLEPGPKQLNEIRGLVTADYQTYLDKKWVQELRARYPVKVNRELLLQIR